MAEMKDIRRLFEIKEEQYKLGLKTCVCGDADERNEIIVALMDLEVEMNELLDGIANDSTALIDVKELLEQIGMNDIDIFLRC